MTEKNVVLFQPRYGDFDSMRTKPCLPLGLLHAASLVNIHYKVDIIDERITPDWEGKVKRYVTEDTVCVGVSSLSGNTIKGGLRFSKYIKDNYKIPVVWGGVHATLLPEQTVSNRNVDIVVVGEGEVTFYELVKILENGGELREVEGIYYKRDGKPVKTSDRGFIDLNEMPDLPYHLLDVKNYLPEYVDKASINFQSSRGCHLKCGYCYNTVVNFENWRALSAEETLKRIGKLVSKYDGIESIYFIDDNFFVEPERALRIMNGLKELNLSWFSQGVDIVTLKRMSDYYYKHMAESNCLKLTIGVESGSPRIRRVLDKGGTPGDILKVADRLKKHNIIFYCNFMVGVPTETKKDIKETVKLMFKIQKINKNFRNSAFSVYVPYPGTPMYSLNDSYYRMPSSLEEWAGYEWNGFSFEGDLRYMYFVSMFIDQKAKNYNIPHILRALAAAYKPVARFRMRNLFFKLMFEMWFYDIIKALWYKIRAI